MPVLNFIVWILVLAVMVTTALPVVNSDQWWVRMWDFPRLHIALTAAFTLVLVAISYPPFREILALVLVGCFLYHAILIFPYTPLAQKEIAYVNSASVDDQIKVMAVNVLMENDRFGELAQMITDEDPDVLFLMETDQRWNDALADVLSSYPTIKRHITDDYYGLIFATKLPANKVELLWPTGDDTPAVQAELVAPDGTKFNFSGLHPRPPVPGNDTTVRDRQTKNMAEMASASGLPTICMGDFNDVAWSHTTRRFKRIGGFSEPRVGRGMLSSFHAQHWFMRFPIDQLYVTDSVGLVSFNRLAEFGSDHFPMQAVITFTHTKDR